MFPIMRNVENYGTRGLLDGFTRALQEISGSTVDTVPEPRSSQARPDARLSWNLPGSCISIDVEVRVAPPTTRTAVRELAAHPGAQVRALVAPFLSPAIREELRQSGWSYWDATGNMLINSRDPFIWVERTGALRNPSPQPTEEPRGLKSLKGRAVSILIVKLLGDGRAESVRELSRQAGTGLATTSRLVDFLRNEELIETRDDDVLEIRDRRRLARRWVQDYSFSNTFKAQKYFSVLGNEIALQRLGRTGGCYAITGTRAASLHLGQSGRLSPLPSSDLWLYTDDRRSIEHDLGLVADGKGDLLVAEADFLRPEGEGHETIGALNVVRAWRAAGDLLSATGRLSSVGEALVDVLAQESSPT